MPGTAFAIKDCTVPVSRRKNLVQELAQLPNVEVLTAPVTSSSGSSEAAAAALAAGGPSGQQQPGSVVEKSPVQLVNDMLARLAQGPAVFDVVQRSGQPNAPSFLMQVSLMGQTYTGEGRSKKLAKSRAAEKALLDTEAWFWSRMRRLQEETGGGGDVRKQEEGGPEKEIDASSDQGRLPGSYPR